MELEAFPALCVEEFGINAVELCQMHFLSTDDAYIHRVKKALQDAAVTLVNIPVDVGYAAEADPAKRAEGFKQIRRWFAIAAQLESPSIRVNTGGRGPEDLERAIEGYRELVKEAVKTGVKLLIENHGGLSQDAENIVRIIEAVGSEYLGTCPDFGGFPPEHRYAGLERIAKYAQLVHAKFYAFDEQGQETTIDVARCVDIMRRNGFTGYYSVEYEGAGDQREGIKRSLALLNRYL